MICVLENGMVDPIRTGENNILVDEKFDWITNNIIQ
jgi:hypothetical protein